jgi:hypothetical protein
MDDSAFFLRLYFGGFTEGLSETTSVRLILKKIDNHQAVRYSEAENGVLNGFCYAFNLNADLLLYVWKNENNAEKTF